MASDKKETNDKVLILTGARELTIGKTTYKRGQPVPLEAAKGFEHYCREAPKK